MGSEKERREVIWKLARDPGLGELGWEEGTFFGITPLRPLSPRAASHLDWADGQEQTLDILVQPKSLRATKFIWSGPACFHEPTLQIKKLRLQDER